MDAGRRDLLYILRWNLSDQLFSVLLFVSALQMAGNSHFLENIRQFYFYDFIGEYITSCIPRQELQQIFNVFAQKLPEDFRKNYIEIVGSLIQNNFNIQNAARQCFSIRIQFYLPL